MMAVPIRVKMYARIGASLLSPRVAKYKKSEIARYIFIGQQQMKKM